MKLAENPFAFAKRCRPFFGGTEYSNYTIEADVRAMERRRQMGDIGLVAQRYELVLFGTHQRLELQPWQPETQRTARIEFPWKKDTWYTMKLEVQIARRRQSARPGQSVAEGRDRAVAVDDRARRSHRKPQGQPRSVRGCAVTSRRRFRALLRQHQGVSEPEARRGFPMKHTVTTVAGALVLGSLSLAARSDPSGADWPMWGGTPDRNMVSSMKGLPTTLGRQDEEEREVGGRARLAGLRQSGRRERRGARRHQQRGDARSEAVKGDKGVLMAFRESDGQFLWQAVHDKLAAGRANDWPFQGVCSSPLIENGTAYYVSNRGELMAVDIDGFRDGIERRSRQGREADRARPTPTSSGAST